MRPAGLDGASFEFLGGLSVFRNLVCSVDTEALLPRAEEGRLDLAPRAEDLLRDDDRPLFEGPGQSSSGALELEPTNGLLAP